MHDAWLLAVKDSNAVRVERPLPLAPRAHPEVRVGRRRRGWPPGPPRCLGAALAELANRRFVAVVPLLPEAWGCAGTAPEELDGVPQGCFTGVHGAVDEVYFCGAPLLRQSSGAGGEGAFLVESLQRKLTCLRFVLRSGGCLGPLGAFALELVRFQAQGACALPNGVCSTQKVLRRKVLIRAVLVTC